MNFYTQNVRFILWIFCAQLCLFPTSILAHRLIVKAHVSGDSIYAQGYMENGKPSVQAKAILQDNTGKTLLATETNQQGQCVFPIMQHSPLKVMIFDQFGHHGETTLAIPQTKTPITNHHSQNDMAQIMDQKLAPLIAAIAHLQHEQEHANVRDIIGGIGYIIGLVGMGLYFSSKKKT